MKYLIGIILILTATVAAAPRAPHKTYAPKKDVSLYAKDWGLASIHVNEARGIQKGNHKLMVAVIDTGTQSSHPALAGWVNDGWNMISNSPGTEDTHGHGTHIAGIIHQIADVTLVPYEYCSGTSNEDNLALTVKAIYRAVDDGCKIINYSGGGTDFSEKEFLAIKYASEHGVLFVAAAGNEHSNSDEPGKHYYPADYDLPNVISVGNIDRNDNLVSSSNYGAKTVHLAAPGENIFSTLPGDRYGYMTGTSQATAFVTGVAALILSQHPSFSPATVRWVLTNTADHPASLKGKIKAGKLNAYKALQLLSK